MEKSWEKSWGCPCCRDLPVHLQRAGWALRRALLPLLQLQETSLFFSPPSLPCPPQAKQSLATLTKDVPKRHSLAMPGETVLNGNQEWVLQADLPLTAAIRQSQQTLYHSHPQHSADRQGETPRPGHSNSEGFWGEICSGSSLVSPAWLWLPWLGWKSARQMSIGSRIQGLAQWAWLAFGFCRGLSFLQA